MNLLKYFLVGLISILSITSIVWVWMEHHNLQSRVETMEQLLLLRNYKLKIPDNLTLSQKDSMFLVQKDSLLRIIELKTSKEEYYLIQMDIQSNWYITYVTLLFVLFSFIGFGIFESKLTQIIKQQDEQDRKYKEHNEKFKDVEGNLHTVMGNVYSVHASSHLKTGDKLGALNHKLFAIEEYVEGLGLKENDTESINAINAVLEEMEELIEIIIKDIAIKKIEKYIISNEIDVNITNAFKSILKKIDDEIMEEKIRDIRVKFKEIMQLAD